MVPFAQIIMKMLIYSVALTPQKEFRGWIGFGNEYLISCKENTGKLREDGQQRRQFMAEAIICRTCIIFHCRSATVRPLSYGT